MSERSDLLQSFIISCFRPAAKSRSHPHDQDDWASLSDALEKASLLAFAYHATQIGMTDWIPPTETLLSWRRMAHRVALQNAYFETNAAAVFNSLNDAGIRYVLLKGFALSDACYANRSIREIGDIDILVDPQSLDETICRLEALDFEFCPSPEFANLAEAAMQASKDNLHELSFRKVSGPFFIDIDLQRNPNRYLEGSFIDEMFPESRISWLDNTRKINIHGIQVNCLNLEMEFLFCVFHYVLHHLLSGPKWCVDICQLIKIRGHELDWGWMADQIMNQNLRHLVTLALHICCDIIGDNEILEKATKAGFNKNLPSSNEIKKYQTSIFCEPSLLRRYMTFITLPALFSDRLKLLQYLLFDKTASMEGRNPEVNRGKWANFLFVTKRAMNAIKK